MAKKKEKYELGEDEIDLEMDRDEKALIKRWKKKGCLDNWS